MEPPMSDVIRPKRHHRRNRAGRRKKIATIDSIVPGRAPLGFIPPELEHTPYYGLGRNQISCASDVSDDSSTPVVEAPGCHRNCSVVSSSTVPFQSLEAARIKLLSPLDSFSSAHDTTRSKSDTAAALPHFKQHSAPVFSGIGEYASYIPQHPLSTTQLASATTSVSDGCTPTGFVDSVPTRPSSSGSGSQAVSLGMGTVFIPSLSSQARAAELNAASAARARNMSRELDDFNELASSQPIPLTALSMRTHSRNKGSKSWRPLSLQDVEESVAEVNFPRSTDVSGTRIVSLNGTTRVNETERTAELHNSMTSVLRDKPQNSGNVNLGSTRQWTHGIDGRLHENPLNQYVMSGSPSDRSSSESNYHYVPLAPFSGPVSPVYTRTMQSGRTSPPEREIRQTYRDFQQNVTCQDRLQDEPFMPQSELPLYTSDSYSATGSDHLRMVTGREVTSRPIRHEQLYTYRRRFEALDISKVSENEFRDDHSRYSTVYGHADSPVGNTNVGSTGPVCYPQTPKSLSALSSNSAKRYGSTKAKSSFNESVHSSKKLEPYDTKKEMAAYLNSVLEASKSNTARTVLRDPVSANKGTAYVGQMSQESPQDKLEYSFLPHEHTILESKEMLANDFINPSSGGRDKRAPPMTPAAPKENVNERSAEPPGCFSSKLKITSMGTDASGSSATNGNTVKFPPPGLPIPAIPMDLAASAEYFPHANARLVESNTWFHTDNRGEKQLRQRVRQIAREDVGRRMRLRGDAYVNESDVTAVQTTVLLGDVIANLQSYIGRSRGDFADFGDVPPHCCEPSHGGRRSYFDRDPSLDQLRFPPGRATFDRHYRPYGRAAEAKLLGSRRLQ